MSLHINARGEGAIYFSLAGIIRRRRLCAAHGARANKHARRGIGPSARVACVCVWVGQGGALSGAASS